MIYREKLEWIAMRNCQVLRQVLETLILQIIVLFGLKSGSDGPNAHARTSEDSPRLAISIVCAGTKVFFRNKKLAQKV